MTTGKTIGLQFPGLWECGLDSHRGLHWQAASKTVTLHGCFYISTKIEFVDLREGLLNAVSSDLELPCSDDTGSEPSGMREIFPGSNELAGFSL